MDREFPSVLFPSLYNNDSPDTALGHCGGSWGSYGQLRPHTPQTSSCGYSFTAQHEAVGEVWRHTEPVPVPLFSPKHAVVWPSTPANIPDFSEQLQNFFVDYPSDVFSSTASLLGNAMNFRRHKKRRDLKDIGRISHFMDKLKYHTCPWSLSSVHMDQYSRLLSDAVHSVPVEPLASLLHEELSLQSLEAAFSEGRTGGALDLIPYASSTAGVPETGCLVYCANGVDKLTFQQVALQPGAVVCADEASTFLLKGPVQQISSSSTCGHSCVAVRSLYHCGVWSVSSSQQPHLLQAMSSTQMLSCVSVSPHVVGELLVASESGAAHLWRLGQGMQLVRTEDSNLYFNGQSSWRWSEFSAHPRVMVYADRTGAELTDIRVQPSSCHTLFRISKAADCRSGERLLLCRYLSNLHSFHHLVITQYSAYIMDERFPCVPMLKWDHMMESPPVFSHFLLGSGGSTGGVAKILLGSQHAQEVTMLQYSGGGSEACVSLGPPQALLRPRDSVERLPVQIPHRTEGSRNRLTQPATGMTAVQQRNSASEETFCVLQLLQTGDVFYQILEKASSPTEKLSDTSERQAQLPTSHPVKPHLSEEATSIWKHWLQKLARSPEADKSGGAMEKTSLLVPKRSKVDPKMRRQALQDLRQSMCERSSTVSSTEAIEPLRVDVQAEEWSDELSGRLTAGWGGEAAWQSWWAERLGATAAERTQALRRKRRKEKEARRASGLSLLAMSGSFTSSLSYQSELSDVSDWAWSDAGGAGSHTEDPPTQDSPDKRRSIPVSAGTEERVKPRPQEVGTEERVKPRPQEVGTEERVKPRPQKVGTEERVKPRPQEVGTEERVRPRPQEVGTEERVKPRPQEVRTEERVKPRPQEVGTEERVKPRPQEVGTEERVKPRPQEVGASETVELRPLVETPTRERRAERLRSETSRSLDPSFTSSPSLPPSSAAHPLLSVTPKPVDSPRDTSSRSQSSQRLSQSSQPRKKSRMGF